MSRNFLSLGWKFWCELGWERKKGTRDWVPQKIVFFDLFYYTVVRWHFIAHLSQVVARGDGYYELQSTTCVYGILLISHHLPTMSTYWVR